MIGRTPSARYGFEFPAITETAHSVTGGMISGFSAKVERDRRKLVLTRRIPKNLQNSPASFDSRCFASWLRMRTIFDGNRKLPHPEPREARVEGRTDHVRSQCPPQRNCHEASHAVRLGSVPLGMNRANAPSEMSRFAAAMSGARAR